MKRVPLGYDDVVPCVKECTYSLLHCLLVWWWGKKECLAHFVAMKVREGAATRRFLFCPQLDCQSRISEDVIVDVLQGDERAEVLKGYEHLCLQQEVRTKGPPYYLPSWATHRIIIILRWGLNQGCITLHGCHHLWRPSWTDG